MCWCLWNNVIDADGFRSNVGIIIANGAGQVFWAKRVQQGDSWQFPQGGIDSGESPRDAMFRELYEEVGLQPEQVRVLGQTQSWLRYRIPPHLMRRKQKPQCVGQKQKWFLLRLEAEAEAINLYAGTKPEFVDWRWVSYWYPVGQVVAFKRDVYRRAMTELAPMHNRLLQEA